jgi:hypothetical protein
MPNPKSASNPKASIKEAILSTIGAHSQNQDSVLAHDFARNDLNNLSIVASFYNRHNSYHNKQDKEVKESVLKGFNLAWCEAHTAKNGDYIKQGEAYVLCNDKAVFNAHKGQKIAFTMGYALSLSTSEFAQLGKTDNALHGMVKAVRTSARTFSAMRHTRFVSALKTHDNELKGIVKPPRVTYAIKEWVKKEFTVMDKKFISEKARGGVNDSDISRYRKAVVAFNAIWLHQE